MANLFLLQALAQADTTDGNEQLPTEGCKCPFTQIGRSPYGCWGSTAVGRVHADTQEQGSALHLSAKKSP